MRGEFRLDGHCCNSAGLPKMTNRAFILGHAPNDRFFLFDDFHFSMRPGPITAFEVASQRAAEEAYRIVLVGKACGRARASVGVALDIEALSNVETIDTLIVAGGLGTGSAMACEGTSDLFGKPISAPAGSAASAPARSLLAAAGFAGRPLCHGTHWEAASGFARKFPKVRTLRRPNRSEGRVWTSAGVSAGIDLALELIAEDLGEEIARQTARRWSSTIDDRAGSRNFRRCSSFPLPITVFPISSTTFRRSLDFHWTVEALARSAYEPAPVQPRLRGGDGTEPGQGGGAAAARGGARADRGGRRAHRSRRRQGWFRRFPPHAPRLHPSFGVPPQSLRRQARASTPEENLGERPTERRVAAKPPCSDLREARHATRKLRTPSACGYLPPRSP